MLEGLREIKPWQVGVLVAMVVGGIGAAIVTYALVDRSGDANISSGQQLVPVTVGDLVNGVSINGSLVFPDRDTLTFGVPGTVAEILVEEGERVEQDQPLARLDSETAAGLEEAVAQAEIDLRGAEEALAKALDPHTPLEIAKAEAAVANARLALSEAREAVDAMLTPPSAHEIAQAEAAVIDSRIAVDNASSTLAALLAGPTAEETGDLQSKIDSASVTLANARRDLSLTQNDWDDKLSSALEATDVALDAYKAVFANWLGSEPADEETNGDPDALLASWGADLDSLFDPAARFADLPARVGEGLPTDDPATVWDESVVYLWVNFSPGDIAPTCDDGVVPNEGWCVKKEMDDAWTVLVQARDDQETKELQAAKAIDSAEAAVARADEALVDAQDALAELAEPAAALDIESAEKRLEVALLALDEAESDLTTLRAGPNALDLEARRKQVLVAEASLLDAEDDLSDLLTSVDPLEIAVREAGVASRKAAMETARQRLEGAVIKAPWAGVVSEMRAELAQSVNAGTPIMEIVDRTVVEVGGVVDEIDVLFVQVGAQATVSMDALPGQVLTGVVSEIAPSAESQQGVVSYPVSIRLQLPQGLELPEGLSAVAEVVIREDRDVLLVPLDALSGTFDSPLVRVMTDTGIVERPVVLGNNDDFWVVVADGLVAGEMVVVEASEAATQGFGFGRGFGGGFGGGQGGFGRVPGGGAAPAR